MRFFVLAAVFDVGMGLVVLAAAFGVVK